MYVDGHSTGSVTFMSPKEILDKMYCRKFWKYTNEHKLKVICDSFTLGQSKHCLVLFLIFKCFYFDAQKGENTAH